VSRVLVVPAAGRGTRLGAALPKVLVPVAGRPMLRHLVDLHRPFVDHVVVVASPSGERLVRQALGEWRAPATVAVQAEPTGMLDAILIGLGAIPVAYDRAWFTWGDQVAVLPATLARLASVERDSDVALPIVERDEPYIHFDRDASGRICGVRQRREGDAMPARGENDMGLFSLSHRAAGEWLPAYAREAPVGAATGERNFVPFVAWASARGTVATCACTDPIEAVGINTPEELAAIERVLSDRARSNTNTST
jgi:bifunctional N-acetylglucosamine-1-phosphate-uridyltransferase/glucosamine-1-phosphate-acetyltransferase GlmU-like protein